MIRSLLLATVAIVSLPLSANTNKASQSDTFEGAQAWESLVGADQHSDEFIVAGVRWFAEHKALENCKAFGFAKCVVLKSSVDGSCRSQCTGRATVQGFQLIAKPASGDITCTVSIDANTKKTFAFHKDGEGLHLEGKTLSTGGVTNTIPGLFLHNAHFEGLQAGATKTIVSAHDSLWGSLEYSSENGVATIDVSLREEPASGNTDGPMRCDK